MKLVKKAASNRPFALGAVLLLFFLTAAAFAPLIAPYDPWKMTIPYLKPSADHLLGTNDIGQDIFSELVYGTRVSLFIGTVAAFITTFVGTLVGAISGYFGGAVDRALMAVVNVIIVIPSLPLTVVLVAYLNAGLWSIIIAICVTSWAGTARLIRSQVCQLRQQPFVQLERTLGMSDGFILARHILPNIWNVVLMKGSLSVASAMLAEAGLSFLGLGASNQKSWGSIIHNAFFRNGVINNYWWWFYPPIICICLCVVGFMLLGYWDDDSGESRRLLSM